MKFHRFNWHIQLVSSVLSILSDCLHVSSIGSKLLVTQENCMPCSCPQRVGRGKPVSQAKSRVERKSGWPRGRMTGRVRVERDAAAVRRAAWQCGQGMCAELGVGVFAGQWGRPGYAGPRMPDPRVWTQSGKEFPRLSSLDLVLTFSSMSVLVTSTSSAKPTSLSRLIPRPSLSKTFQVNRQPSSATVSRNWSSNVSNI